MKKLFLTILCVMFLLGPVYADDRACDPIWTFVAGQTYRLNVGDQAFDVQFSESYSGPAPQGICEIYDGVYIAPRMTCRYMAHGDNLISITCDGVDIPFMLMGDKLILVDPDAPFMTRKVDK